MHNTSYKEPTLHWRAFQLAVEVTYSHQFNQQTLQDFYLNAFYLQDTFNVNHKDCDQSTVYTAMVIKLFKQYSILIVKILLFILHQGYNSIYAK
jgi:hypothetical protein